MHTLNIPTKLKIGGVIYKVKKTSNLFLGNDYRGECLNSDLTINIRPTLEKQIQDTTFLHEMLHAIYFNLGYKEHDEKKIDELANALYQVFEDNPEIFEKRDKKVIDNGSWSNEA